MEIIVYSAVFMLGACIASFSNCISYRVPRKMNWISGRSKCLKCGKQLTLLELIPVFSCLALRARCSKCHEYFGWRNAITEFLLGLVCTVGYSSGNGILTSLLRVISLGCVYCAVSLLIEFQKIQK